MRSPLLPGGGALPHTLPRPRGPGDRLQCCSLAFICPGQMQGALPAVRLLGMVSFWRVSAHVLSKQSQIAA